MTISLVGLRRDPFINPERDSDSDFAGLEHDVRLAPYDEGALRRGAINCSEGIVCLTF